MCFKSGAIIPTVAFDVYKVTPLMTSCQFLVACSQYLVFQCSNSFSEITRPVPFSTDFKTSTRLALLLA
jgi:hypothetical protein